MEDIKRKVEELIKLNKKEDIVKWLQEINKLFLTKYMLKIDDLCIYPIEVEAYYNGNNFDDKTVHNKPKQKNRFGKLYCHGSGMDVCLSDSGDYAFGILIRAAYVQNEDNLQLGPINLIDDVFHQCKRTKNLPVNNKKEKEERNCILEKIEDVIANTTNDMREIESLVFNAPRVNVTPKDSDFVEYHLRSLIEYKKYKEKEKKEERVSWPKYKGKILRAYIKDSGQNICLNAKNMEAKMKEFLKDNSSSKRDEVQAEIGKWVKEIEETVDITNEIIKDLW